jgi:dolichol-phosphate mannosyltransferase
MQQSTPTDVSFAVVIPMYNEEAGAKRCVTEVGKVLSSIPQQGRLIVVDDGSKDATPGILSSLASEFPFLEILTHNPNQGYGAALRTGIRHAINKGYDYALIMDSDLTNDPKDIPRFVEKMLQGYDVIKATRYSRGGGTRDIPFERYIISRVGNIIAKKLFRLPISDITNGFRAAKTSILKQFELSERNFSIIVEELYFEKALGCTMTEVPVVLTTREDERGTSFSYRPRIFYDYLKYPLRSFLGLKVGSQRF